MPDEAAIREARIAVARRASCWTEIEEVDLVPRGPRESWLVSATTDEIFDGHSSCKSRLGHLRGTAIDQDAAPTAWILERTMGLEPTTPGLGSQCSTN